MKCPQCKSVDKISSSRFEGENPHLQLFCGSCSHSWTESKYQGSGASDQVSGKERNPQYDAGVRMHRVKLLVGMFSRALQRADEHIALTEAVSKAKSIVGRLTEGDFAAAVEAVNTAFENEVADRLGGKGLGVRGQGSGEKDKSSDS